MHDTIEDSVTGLRRVKAQMIGDDNRSKELINSNLFKSKAGQWRNTAVSDGEKVKASSQ